MDLGIVGKTALVVGASKGIGREVAKQLVAEGCRVIGVARDAGLLSTLRGVEGFSVDLMRDGAAQAAISWITARCGAPDIIYHALGGSWQGIKAVLSPPDDWGAVWRYNLGVAIEVNNAFLPEMQQRRWGRVVHTSSDAVKHAIGNPPYASAKFALEGYVRVAAKVYAADNVILSAARLGPIYREGGYLYTRTEEETYAYFHAYLPTRRFGTASEAARTVLYLCSNHASFMAGAVVDVDGGSR